MISGIPCPSATWSRSKPLRIPPVLLPPTLPSWVPHCGTSQRVSKGKRACGRGGMREGCRGPQPHLQGLDAAGDDVGNHAHLGPLLRVLRQEAWSGPSFLQVLNDGQLFGGEQ